MEEVWALLQENDDWLWRRARFIARKLRLSEADAEDIRSEAYLEFVEKAGKGWFEGPTHQSLQARARHLLGLCLRHAETRRVRGLIRSAADADEELAKIPSNDGDEEGSYQDELMLERLRANLEELNPSHRLYLKALTAPDSVDKSDLETAETYSAGGAKPLVRPMREAWALYQEYAADDSLTRDFSGWKQLVAEIFRSDLPVGSMPPSERKRAVNYIDAQLSRGRKRLVQLLA